MKNNTRWFDLFKTVDIPALIITLRLFLFCRHEWEPVFLTTDGHDGVVGKECRHCGRVRGI